MKIITILSFCLTASLSFAHSEIFAKEINNTFTYDYSGICTNTQNCQFIKRSDMCDTSSQVFSGYYDNHLVAFSDKCNPYRSYIPIELPSFSSEADANAFFNVFVLTNASNNQLGYLRWITYEFNDSIKNYMINLDATITEHLTPLFPLDQSPISFDIYDLSEFQCSNSELITRIHGNPCPMRYIGKSLKKYAFPIQADTISYDYSGLCTDTQNCQFIKRSDIYDSPYILRSYCDPSDFLDNYILDSYMSTRYILLELPSFSSEADANAFFNIHILNNTSNNQLGYLRWITTVFYSENYDHKMNIDLFRSHHITSFDTTIMESFTNPVQPNINIHFPKQPQAILDELNNFNAIFLWTEEDIKHITFDTALHAEQHQLLIHPLANQTTTYIDTRHMKDTEDVSIRLYQPPSTWIIENNTNSNITALLCADDSRKIEENRVYGYGSPNGCIKMPIEYVTYSNKLHPKCTMQLTPFSSQIFDSSIFLKKFKNNTLSI